MVAGIVVDEEKSIDSQYFPVLGLLRGHRGCEEPIIIGVFIVDSDDGKKVLS